MQRLTRQSGELIKTCSTLLLDSSDTIKEEAFITICDLLVVFSRQIGINPMLAPLVYEPSENMQNMLSDFVQEHVFIEEEEEGEYSWNIFDFQCGSCKWYILGHTCVIFDGSECVFWCVGCIANIKMCWMTIYNQLL